MNEEQQKHLDELESNGIEQVKKMCESHGLVFKQTNTEHKAYDCFIYNPLTGKTSICEIKNRFNADKYDTLYMEIDKYERLLKWKEHYEAFNAFYINVVGKKIYIFEIDNSTISKYTPVKKWMNTETYKSTTNKTMKEVIELPKKDAKIVYNN